MRFVRLSVDGKGFFWLLEHGELRIQLEIGSSWLEDVEVRAWLLTVAKHKALNYLKVQQRYTSLEADKTAFIFEPHVPPLHWDVVARCCVLDEESSVALFASLASSVPGH